MTSAQITAIIKHFKLESQGEPISFVETLKYPSIRLSKVNFKPIRITPQVIENIISCKNTKKIFWFLTTLTDSKKTHFRGLFSMFVIATRNPYLENSVKQTLRDGNILKILAKYTRSSRIASILYYRYGTLRFAKMTTPVSSALQFISSHEKFLYIAKTLNTFQEEDFKNAPDSVFRHIPHCDGKILEIVKNRPHLMNLLIPTQTPVD